MADDKVKLPVSSLSTIETIIQGYAHASAEVTLDELTRLTATPKDTITRTNPFLLAAGLIDGGMKKRATETGRKLGRALEHGQEMEVGRLLREVVAGNEFLSNLVTTVRLKSGMSQEDLTAHILFTADVSDTGRNRTGAGAIVDLLMKAKLLRDESGILTVMSRDGDPPSEVDAPRSEEDTTVEPPVPTTGGSSSGTPHVQTRTAPAITINIQLQLPETEKSVVYDNLFKSLRENLLKPEEGDA